MNNPGFAVNSAGNYILLWRSNIRGFHLCMVEHYHDNDGVAHLGEDLSLTSEDIQALATILDMDKQDLTERLTVRSQDLTMGQLVAVIEYMESQNEECGDITSYFQLDIARIEEEFADQHVSAT